MKAQSEQPAEEITRLQRCINDLVGVTALPATWSGGEPAEIVRTLLDVLFDTLRLDLIYVRLEVAVGEAPIEMARVAQSLSLAAGPREIGEVFNRWMGGDPRILYSSRIRGRNCGLRCRRNSDARLDGCGAC